MLDTLGSDCNHAFGGCAVDIGVYCWTFVFETLADRTIVGLLFGVTSCVVGACSYTY